MGNFLPSILRHQQCHLRDPSQPSHVCPIKLSALRLLCDDNSTRSTLRNQAGGESLHLRDSRCRCLSVLLRKSPEDGADRSLASCHGLVYALRHDVVSITHLKLPNPVSGCMACSVCQCSRDLYRSPEMSAKGISSPQWQMMEALEAGKWRNRLSVCVVVRRGSSITQPSKI